MNTIIVALLAFGGYYLYTKSQAAASTTSTASTATPIVSQPNSGTLSQQLLNQLENDSTQPGQSNGVNDTNVTGSPGISNDDTDSEDDGLNQSANFDNEDEDNG